MDVGQRQMIRILGALAIVLGLAAMAGSYWVWTDYKNEFRRMSSELAAMKVSLALVAQRPPSASFAAPVDASSADQIADLKNRLAILEGVWRNPSSGISQPTPTPAPGGQPPGDGPKTDCIPAGTRFLLTPNDTYPVCQTHETLTLLSVAEGEVVLDKFGPVPQGGIIKLGASNCSVSVLSALADGGFAEVRVSC
jgi:hypothetical protein